MILSLTRKMKKVHAGAGVLKVEGKSLQFSPAKPVDTKLSWHSQNYIPR